MAIETWQDAIGTIATVKGFPDVVLRIKHIHADLETGFDDDDLRPFWGKPLPRASCVCEVVSGTPPQSWETCTPFGHYRVTAWDLVLEGEDRGD